MRRLLLYLRQVFCKHDMEWSDFFYRVYVDEFRNKKYNNITVVYGRCKYCGYHTKHWKDKM